MNENIIIPYYGESYDSYILRISYVRDNLKDPNFYQELHHIVPKSIGGLDYQDNLIWLYASEHYYAHKLLAEENPDNHKLSVAWWMMSHIKNGAKDIFVSSEDYEKSKLLFIMNYSGANNPNYGKKASEATRKKMSNSQKGKIRSEETKKRISLSKTGDKHPMFGKHIPEEIKNKMSKSHSGEKNYWFGKTLPDDIKIKIGKANAGRKHTKEEIEKISKASSGSNNPRARSVKCIENGMIFSTVKDAAEYASTQKSTISGQISGKYNYAGRHPETGDKLHWIYVELKT